MKIQKIKSRKAILLPELMKIIIGVLCIVLLVYIAVSLYGIFSRGHELEQAKFTLDAIIAKTSSLTEGQILDYLVTSPKDWRFLVYDSEKKVCICPAYTSDTYDKVSQQQTICLKQGVCKSVDYSISVGGYETSCSQGAKQGLSSGISNCLSFDTMPLIISIFKNSNGVVFSKKLFDSSTGKSSDRYSIPASIRYMGGDGNIQTLSTNFLVEKSPTTNHYVLDFSTYFKLIPQSDKGYTPYFYFYDLQTCEYSASSNDKKCVVIYMNRPLGQQPDFVGEVYSNGEVWLAREYLKSYYTLDKIYILGASDGLYYKHDTRFFDGSYVDYFKTTLNLDYDRLVALVQTK
jgi:hypothetical protein